MRNSEEMVAGFGRAVAQVGRRGFLAAAASLCVAPAGAQTPAGPAVLDDAVQAVMRSIDEVAIRQGNTYVTSFTVQSGARPPPTPSYGFVQPLMPAPAAPVAQSGTIAVQVWSAPEAVQIRTLPGTDWTAQVTARIRGYSFQAGPRFGPQTLQMLNFLQWTVVSEGGRVRAVVRPPQESAALTGAPDEGLREYVAKIFGLQPGQVQVARPQSD